jgi:hypothetical protein
VGTWYMHWRVRTAAGKSQLLRYLRRHHLLFALYYAGGAAFLLLLAWANSVGGCQGWAGSPRSRYSAHGRGLPEWRGDHFSPVLAQGHRVRPHWSAEVTDQHLSSVSLPFRPFFLLFTRCFMAFKQQSGMVTQQAFRSLTQGADNVSGRLLLGH